MAISLAVYWDFIVSLGDLNDNSMALKWDFRIESVKTVVTRAKIASEHDQYDLIYFRELIENPIQKKYIRTPN